MALLAVVGFSAARVVGEEPVPRPVAANTKQAVIEHQIDRATNLATYAIGEANVVPPDGVQAKAGAGNPKAVDREESGKVLAVMKMETGGAMEKEPLSRRRVLDAARDEEAQVAEAPAGKRQSGLASKADSPDMARIKDLMSKGKDSPEFKDALQKARAEGLAVLAADREKVHAARGTKKAPVVASVLASDPPQSKREPPQKLAVGPLPDKAKEIKARTDAERQQELDELRKKIQNETEPHVRERDLLLLAAKQVGQDDWTEAKKIYDQLRAESKDPDVQEAAGRNLEVARKTIAVREATDPRRKQVLQLELAKLHRDLGHERASKAFLRELAQDGTDPTVRQVAERLLSEKPQAFRPPMPARLKATGKEELGEQQPPETAPAGKAVAP